MAKPLSHLTHKIRLAPRTPGVYLFKNPSDKIIYIGKAVNLHNRVTSYLSSADPKTRMLMTQASDLELIPTSSDVEALTLEESLIKLKKPKYNVRLKDDKKYPYLKITLGETYPRIFTTRNPVPHQLRPLNKRLVASRCGTSARGLGPLRRSSSAADSLSTPKTRGRILPHTPSVPISEHERGSQASADRAPQVDGSALFGPYTSARALRQTVSAVSRIFGLRTCKQPLPLKRPRRPCLKYSLGRCSAPCIPALSAAEYRKIVDEVILLLNGKSARLEQELESRMWQAARIEKYEAAKQYRDQLHAIRHVQQRQHLVTRDGIDRDVIGLARAHRVAVVAFFKIRDNKLFAREVYRLSVDPLSQDSEIVAAFIRSTYLHQSFFPDEIVVPLDPDDSATLRKWFAGRGKSVNFVLGRYEDKRALADWARRSAELELGISAGARPLPQSLLELAGALKLKSPPRWIEAFDVSNIMGTAAVGASVSFKDGKPDKSRYRRFRIKRTRGQNDFAMIKEIVSRRLRQMDKERPDLLLIDGGKGQLSAARAGLDAVNLDLPVLAFAKRTDQLFFQDGRVITIPVASPALYLLKRIRNESHRFAITYHRKVRGRETRASVLDRIPGIGPAKKIELLRYFGSIERLRAASKEEISRVKGVQKIIAERIYEALHT